MPAKPTRLVQFVHSTVIPLAATALLLAGCAAPAAKSKASPQASATHALPTATQTPSATHTPVSSATRLPPTATYTPSATRTPTPTVMLTPTITPTLTATAVPTLNLGQFSAELCGGEESEMGTMVCITNYSGNQSDLEDLTLLANVNRDGSPVQRDIPAQKWSDGGIRFDLLDVNYVQVDRDTGILSPKPGYIFIEIYATAIDGKVLNNSAQNINLGEYIQFRFIPDPFISNKLACVSPFLSHKPDDYEGFHLAWDLIPKGKDPVVGTKVRLSSGQVTSSWAGESNYIYILSPTGFLIGYSHTRDLAQYSEKSIPFGQPIFGVSNKYDELQTEIGPQDINSQKPHIHINVGIPFESIDFSTMDNAKTNAIIYATISGRGFLFSRCKSRIQVCQTTCDLA